MKNLPSVTISGALLSDLFFNSNLKNYNAASELSTRADENTPEAYKERTEAALLLDAQEFAAQFNGDINSKDLVENFLERI
jgi:hypothetical protein